MHKCIGKLAEFMCIGMDSKARFLSPLLHLCSFLTSFFGAEGEGKSSKPAASNSMVTACALFDKTGDLIFVGQSKGTITVVDANSFRFIDMIKVCPGWNACRNCHPGTSATCHVCMVANFGHAIMFYVTLTCK